MDLYLGMGIAGSAIPRFYLKTVFFETHHVILAYRALVLKAEDLLGLEAPSRPAVS